MERNYDEIIADMLIQLDRHGRVLDQHSKILEKLSIRQKRHEKLFADRMEGIQKVERHLTEQLVHSATLLDRVIRRNKLKL